MGSTSQALGTVLPGDEPRGAAAVATLSTAARLSHHRHGSGGNGRPPRRHRPVAGLWCVAVGGGGRVGVQTTALSSSLGGSGGQLSPAPSRSPPTPPSIGALDRLSHWVGVGEGAPPRPSPAGGCRSVRAVDNGRGGERPRLGRRASAVGGRQTTRRVVPGTRGIRRGVWMLFFPATRPPRRTAGRRRGRRHPSPQAPQQTLPAAPPSRGWCRRPRRHERRR